MDQAGPQRDLPEHDGDADRGAERRPEGIRAPTFAEVALKLLDQGYEPVPVTPKSKRVPATSWTTARIDEAQVENWCREFGHCGVGLRTGHLVGVDIDILDLDLAHQAEAVVTARLGQTIVRVGLWPKRVLLYRTLTPFAKMSVGKIEVLGQGQQFVAFGIHPITELPYQWPRGESPLDVSLDALPLVDETMIEALLAELQPIAGAGPTGSRRGGGGGGGQGQIRNADGLVTDGRDGWLSIIAFHAVHDALERGEEPDEAALGEIVWARFVETTDLSRPRQDGHQGYGLRDALRKIRDKIKLHRVGQLPDRSKTIAAPDYVPPSLDVEAARLELDHHLDRAMEATEGWVRSAGLEVAPRIGIRATVGLGKSTAARRHIMELMQRLAADYLPHRILNLVPSLALADETAAAWRDLGIPTAVLRGYEAVHPLSRTPMCGDLLGVRAAIAAKVDIQSSVCFRSQGKRCQMFVTCAKQANRREVQEAQIVVAAYDTMFTGFAGDTQDFALILVDEACWSRSFEAQTGLTIEALPQLGIAAVAASRKQDAQGAHLADVVAARQRLSAALASLPEGEVTGTALVSLGLDAGFCQDAIATEHDALAAPHLTPGQGPADRKAALECSSRRALGLQVIGLWSALVELLRNETVAKVWLGGMGKDGQRPIRIWRRKQMASELTRLPLLHLDATLRPELAQIVLPGLEVSIVEAHAPHQHIRLISGSFGKGNLCPDPRANAAENQRRANRLQECVDYVRWHAFRHPGGRTLVITYQATDAAFAEIPGVETAHYNAIAGLNGWGDISALFLIGRLLPSSDNLAEMTGALFSCSVQGEYAGQDIGVLLENGRTSGLRAIRHTDPSAEVLRAAICDDEVMQALGRGRGINRTLDNPLEVHLMADVVLPLAYDRVQAWEAVCPDILQRMLLAGLAVDSPADAAKLHPGLFGNAEQAKKAFQRTAFGGHFPIRDIYREMSLKSASYRLGGKGRGWQRAIWIAGSSDGARAQLERAIGPIVEWEPKA